MRSGAAIHCQPCNVMAHRIVDAVTFRCIPTEQRLKLPRAPEQSVQLERRRGVRREVWANRKVVVEVYWSEGVSAKPVEEAAERFIRA